MKKYYMVVMLVETTSVEQLVDRLRKGKYRSSSDVVAKSAYSVYIPCMSLTFSSDPIGSGGR